MKHSYIPLPYNYINIMFKNACKTLDNTLIVIEKITCYVFYCLSAQAECLTGMIVWCVDAENSNSLIVKK